jgi:deoxyribodipyrimidine photo-lyase
MKEKVNLFWFRRDLRIADNHGLYQALISANPVLPVFIYDTNILNDLKDDDSRVEFISKEVSKLKEEFERNNSTLWIYHGKPLDAFKRLWVEYDVDKVYSNQDYEPYAIERDQEINSFLAARQIRFFQFKDQLVFHKNDVLKPNGKPYTVFTPYSKRWLAKLNESPLENYASEKFLKNLHKTRPLPDVKLRDIGFRRGSFAFPEKKINQKVLKNYAETRDFPALDGTSHLGVHLRFGTLSIRQLTKEALKHSPVFLNELIWRNFFMDILWHFPHVAVRPFNPAYEHVPWLNSEKDFARWRKGTTGYPLVDAGMRQLNQTGFMHNRARMAAASFLCKHLLIDWRWGEAYFADKLLDYELASNNGGWQWAAGTGCDAAPYFRVFNPSLQAQKFDPGQNYIRQWVPGFESPDYPRPMVDHQMARLRAIETYKKALVPI